MKNDWQSLLYEEMQKDYYKKLTAFITAEYASHTIFPPKDQIFTALELTGYHDTRVVILGQDPYHNDGQAHGLSFSVASNDATPPPTLRNIFKELVSDTGTARTNMNLNSWAKQGVLLLNTVLTVRAHQAASHRGKGWERFTDKVIELLNARKKPLIFVLWGKDAQKKLPLIDCTRHKTLISAHPSPLSAHNGFWGSRPFSKINAFLEEYGDTPINWSC